MRLVCVPLLVALAFTGARATPSSLPATVRVDVLSLLSPRRVTVSSTATIRLSNGALLRAGNRLSIDIERATLRARRNGAPTWRGPAISVGSVGDVVSVEVSGRNHRIRLLPAPVALSVVDGRIAVRCDFPLEELVASSVVAEMTESREPAALEAAAIAIRSYVSASRSRHARDGFDVCDSTHCVHSVGLVVNVDSQESTAIIAAVRRSAGKVLMRDGHIVVGYFSACCGGRTTTPAELWSSTETGDYSAVACMWCHGSPYFSWTRVVPVAAVAGALSDALGRPVRADFSIRAERGQTGWVRSVRIDGGTRDRRIPGDEFRMTIGRRLGWDSLPSSNFAVSRERGNFVFRGAGFGHGVGLCLAGAIERARAGDTGDAILRRYFPRARVVSLPQGAGAV